MLPYYTYLLNGNFGIDILVYSGDDDAVCGPKSAGLLSPTG